MLDPRNVIILYEIRNTLNSMSSNTKRAIYSDLQRKDVFNNDPCMEPIRKALVTCIWQQLDTMPL